MSALLTDWNPYLRTAADRKRQVFETVSTSSAIEGVRIARKEARSSVKSKKAAAKVSHAKLPAGASSSARSPKRKAR